MKGNSKQSDSYENHLSTSSEGELFRELVEHLRLNRASLREEWAGRIHKAGLLTAMSREEVFTEATEIFDNYKVYQGIATPLSLTRTFNGDMTSQRFITSVQYNTGLPDSMFIANVTWDPHQLPTKKH